MTDLYREIVRRHARPLKPRATGVRPELKRLPGIAAVLFDLYGTLLLSDIGEIGIADRERSARAFSGALEAVGIRSEASGGEGLHRLEEAVRLRRAAARAEGIDFPEVDIVEVWNDVLLGMHDAEQGEQDRHESDLERLAVEYEARANPVWPVPRLVESLDALRGKGLVLGIISNAQFFSRELFPALLGRTAEDLGFEAGLQFFSYRHGRAKPGLALFRRARSALSRRGIEGGRTLYVGNDMLNDVTAAGRVGFRTALFAGDARSYRPREGAPEVTDARPDVIVTDLRQLVDCVDPEA
jgi:putative hydrolase of the HAD superfamily